MKKEIIHSLVVLVTIVNGVIAGFSLGITELIKYLLKEEEIGSLVSGEVNTAMISQFTIPIKESKENIGWVFFALMLIGIVILIISSYISRRNKAHNLQ